MKIIAHCDYKSLAVAGFSTMFVRSDTDDGHFSFIVYDVDATSFAEALEACLEERNNQDTYYNTQEIVLRAYRSSDTIRIVRDCASVSITRGNLKVLFYGSVDTLALLPKAIRKAIKERDAKEEKYQNEDNKAVLKKERKNELHQMACLLVE